MTNQKRIEQLYVNELLSCREVADVIGKSHSYVHAALKSMDVKLRSPHFRRNETCKVFHDHSGRAKIKLKTMHYIYRLKAAAVVEGGELPPGVCIHHINNNPMDDSYANLAIANTYMHSVNSLHCCKQFEKYMIRLGRYEHLDSKVTYTSDSIKINDNFVQVPLVDVLNISMASPVVCMKCGGCSTFRELD